VICVGCPGPVKQAQKLLKRYPKPLKLNSVERHKKQSPTEKNQPTASRTVHSNIEGCKDNK